jgi:hypothetical protein
LGNPLGRGLVDRKVVGAQHQGFEFVHAPRLCGVWDVALSN